MGELWGVFCWYSWENWPCYNGTALYSASVIVVMYAISCYTGPSCHITQLCLALREFIHLSLDQCLCDITSEGWLHWHQNKWRKNISQVTLIIPFSLKKNFVLLINLFWSPSLGSNQQHKSALILVMAWHSTDNKHCTWSSNAALHWHNKHMHHQISVYCRIQILRCPIDVMMGSGSNSAPIGDKLLLNQWGPS